MIHLFIQSGFTFNFFSKKEKSLFLYYVKNIHLIYILRKIG